MAILSCYGISGDKGLKETLGKIMSIPETIQARVQQDGKVLTTCPGCGKIQPVESDKIANGGRSSSATCSCGETFAVFFERRKAYRREVSLRGTYQRTSPEGKFGEMSVENLSMTGIGFVTLDANNLEEGDKVTLRCVLADGKHAGFEPVAVVVCCHDRYVGCRFKELSRDEEEWLVEYLMVIP
ncbi:MAG: PilZ domain-containing protein [Deltaproteobacteria bacterium]|nr:PilZ domain-containing protein [Deltaproteobacteria bacterium]